MNLWSWHGDESPVITTKKSESSSRPKIAPLEGGDLNFYGVLNTLRDFYIRNDGSSSSHPYLPDLAPTNFFIPQIQVFRQWTKI